jgi:hypothetical protein
MKSIKFNFVLIWSTNLGRIQLRASIIRQIESWEKEGFFGPTTHPLLCIYSHMKNQKLHYEVTLGNTMYNDAIAS